MNTALKRSLGIIGVFFLTSLAFGQTAAPPTITKLPKLLEYVEASYPKAAWRDRVEADVTLELVIAETGQISSVTVLSATTSVPLVQNSTISVYGFDRAAVVAAKKLRFEAAEADGKPIAVAVPYTYRFRLPENLLRAATTQTAANAGTKTGTSTQARADASKPNVLNLSGVLRARGTRRLLPGLIVRVIRQQAKTNTSTEAYEATSDAEGAFRFFDLSPGLWRVDVQGDGYFPVRTTEEIKANEVLEVVYYVEQGTYNPYDVVVEAARVRKEVNRRTLTQAEIVKVPGTLGDPVLVVNNLPGVARTNAGNIVVRGSGPEDTGIYLDGILIPLIYHFGGLKSVIPAEIIETIDFYPGNFSVYYGRALGGIFDGHVKRIKPDQVHGSADLSLLDVSLYVEAPIGPKAAIALAGRRSHIDLILDAVVPDDNVSLATAPRYYDYQALATWRPEAAHQFRAFFLGSNDSVKLLFKNPADINPEFRFTNVNNSTGFNRLTGNYRYAPSKNFDNDFTAAVGRDQIDVEFGEQFFLKINQTLFQGRDTARMRLFDQLRLNIGVDSLISAVDVNIQAPRPPSEGNGRASNPNLDDVRVTQLNNEVFYFVAPFVELEWQVVPRLSLVPGVRLDYFDVVEEFSLDPRLMARYRLLRDFVVKGGVGVTHQAPLPQETDENFGNPELGLERSVQYSVGAEWRPRKYLFLESTLFYKDMQNLVSRTDAVTERDGDFVAQIYDNNGKGRVYGIEMFLEHKFAHNFRGWLSYTLSRAERIDSGEVVTRLFDFDQTHILAVVAAYSFSENWELGLRWRLVSGNLRTPVMSEPTHFLSDQDVYGRMIGPVNSIRLGTFHQLDLRLDKRWIFDVWTFSAYLSLVNTYNQENVENLGYNFDFTQSKPTIGLPLFPILGVRADF